MNKKIRRFVIILGVLAIIFLACVGLGYYYILAQTRVSKMTVLFTCAIVALYHK